MPSPRPPVSKATPAVTSLEPGAAVPVASVPVGVVPVASVPGVVAPALLAGAVVVADLLSEPQATASKPSAATAASEVNRLLVRICSPPWSVCWMDGNIQPAV